METVFRLVEDHRMRSVHYLVGDLLSPMGGKAVHHHHVLLGPADEVGV
jgi:hypothetical protein